MRIALIGGAGFIGHHLALKLREQAHDVLIVDHFAINSRNNLMESRLTNPWADRYLRMLNERADLWTEAGCEFRHADARDYHTLSRKVAAWKPEAIVHLAAVAHITHTRADQHAAFENSILTLKNALDVAHACNTQRFVYFSSSTVYGNFGDRLEVDEHGDTRPDTTYGAFKLAGELFVKSWGRDKGLPFTIVRPQALYGPRCVSRRVTQIFIENALDQKPLRIDGDGSAAHDFTHVSDLVAGICAIFQHLDESRNETFCLTAGKARTLKELAGIVQTHIPCGLINGPPDPEKPSRGTMSPEKAKRLLGWAPSYDLDKGMAEYIAWYREFLSERFCSSIRPGEAGTGNLAHDALGAGAQAEAVSAIRQDP